jgi:tetratricopeptide (TPR) repeat protein
LNGRVVLLVATTAVVVAAAACSHARDTGAALPPVSLPDLSRMEPSVRAQIAAQYETLRGLTDHRTTQPADLARAYGALGGLLLAAESFDAAEPCYLHAEALAPDDMRWPYYLGHVYIGKQQPERAIAAFQRALALRPADMATLVWLGTVYVNQGRPEAATPLFTQALALQPRDVSAHYGLGRAALLQHDYRRAAEQFELVLAIDPRATIAHYPLAQAYRALGDTAKADAHLRQRGGVEVGPPDPLMAEVRGLLQSAASEEARGVRALESGDIAAALTHFRRAVDLAPDNPSPRHRLATALSLTGDTAAAIDQFEETLRRSPDFAPAHYSLGVVLSSQGRYAEAIEHLQAAVRQQPDDVAARLQLGEAFGRSRQFDKSLAQYRQVLAADPQQADAQFGYAMSLVGLGRYSDARAALSAGAARHPEQPRFSDALARLAAAPH